MNLRDELDRIAADAPPVGDAADRALRSARRHRRYVQLPVLVAAAVVAIAVIGSAILRPNLLGLEFEPAGWSGRVEVPASADPLPAKDVGPARMTYIWRCPESAGKNDCVETRVVTEDGRHWTVPDATPLFPSAPVQRPKVVSVSPDGELIVYSKDDGLVLRNLATGEANVIFQLDQSAGVDQVMWSPDSRRTAICLLDGDRRSVDMVDHDEQSASGFSTTSPGDGSSVDGGCPLGIPNGDASIPTVDSASGGIWLDQPFGGDPDDPAEPIEIPASLVGKLDPLSTYGAISPHSSKLALVRSAPEGESSVLDVLGIDPPTRLHRIESKSEPTILGWLDESMFATVSERLDRDGGSLFPNVHDIEVVDVERRKARLHVQVVGMIEAGTISVATGLL